MSKSSPSPILFEVQAKQRFILMTPRKIRRVLDVIRGKRVIEAYAALRLMPYAAATLVLKLAAPAKARRFGDQATLVLGREQQRALCGAESDVAAAAAAAAPSCCATLSIVATAVL